MFIERGEGGITSNDKEEGVPSDDSKASEPFIWHKRKDLYGKVQGTRHFYCKQCLAIYPRPTSIKYHLEKGACKNVQRCSADHSHSFIAKHFDSQEQVKDFLKENEHDTQFIIRASNKGNVYYEVHRTNKA